MCVITPSRKSLFLNNTSSRKKSTSEDATGDFCVLPMSDGISGKDFYIPALHEVLRLESSTLLNDLKDSVGTRKWELLATRLGFQANYYTNRHKQR